MAVKKAPEKLAKTEEKELRDYELTLIINPEIADEALDTTISKISRFITEKGGVVSEVNQWGKRKLAYPIKHFMEGRYVLVRFQLRGVLGKELEGTLKVSEEVLRYLLIKLSD